MKNKKCPSCGQDMKRNGKTSAGTQRWRCKTCGASAVHTNDTTARELDAFLGWLLGKSGQLDMPGQGRSFRRLASRFWKIWPMPEPDGVVHRVVYVDGIYVARNVVVLIACSDEHVLSWYPARSESVRAWKALLSRIAPPDVVVTDGGTGFATAVAEEWPQTKVQRCLFHAFCQVKRQTTTRPKLQAGIEIYGLAKELMHLEDLHQAEWWVERYMQWNAFWSDFLEDKTVVEGRWEYTHARLRTARNGLNTLLNKNLLFTYLDPQLTQQGPLPRTNNRIEGGVNAQLRAVLRNHRGLSLMRRIKAIYWWCYMHTECPLPAAELLKSLPTDADIDLLYGLYAEKPPQNDAPAWGDGIVWQEPHRQARFPGFIDY